jgi:hypothetical protein
MLKTKFRIIKNIHKITIKNRINNLKRSINLEVDKDLEAMNEEKKAQKIKNKNNINMREDKNTNQKTKEENIIVHQAVQANREEDKDQDKKFINEK